MTAAKDSKETRRVLGKGVIQPGSLAEKGLEYAKASGVGRKSHEAGFGKKVLFLGAIAVFLIIVAWVFIVFLPNQYRFSFTVDDVPYYSNEYTPTEFFNVVKDSNDFVVSVALLDGNTDPWTVNSMNLWLVAFNSNHKRTTVVIQSIDIFGDTKNCLTNDGNLFASREIAKEECLGILNNSSAVKINLHPSSENKVVLSQNRADIFAQSGRLNSTLNYLVIKSIFPNFDTTLSIINEKINAVNPTK
ncbi:Uncharacterised protein [uncultured archaeon]|nr:Uncharacterised protein [uncultured archaeon]